MVDQRDQYSFIASGAHSQIENMDMEGQGNGNGEAEHSQMAAAGSPPVVVDRNDKAQLDRAQKLLTKAHKQSRTPGDKETYTWIAHYMDTCEAEFRAKDMELLALSQQHSALVRPQAAENDQPWGLRSAVKLAVRKVQELAEDPQFWTGVDQSATISAIEHCLKLEEGCGECGCPGHVKASCWLAHQAYRNAEGHKAGRRVNAWTHYKRVRLLQEEKSKAASKERIRNHVAQAKLGLVELQ